MKNTLLKVLGFSVITIATPMTQPVLAADPECAQTAQPAARGDGNTALLKYDCDGDVCCTACGWPPAPDICCCVWDGEQWAC